MGGRYALLCLYDAKLEAGVSLDCPILPCYTDSAKKRRDVPVIDSIQTPLCIGAAPCKV